jgi:hypothetical protein
MSKLTQEALIMILVEALKVARRQISIMLPTPLIMFYTQGSEALKTIDKAISLVDPTWSDE